MEVLGNAKDALFFSTILLISIAKASFTFIHSIYSAVLVKQINLISIELAANCSILTYNKVSSETTKSLLFFI